MLHRLGHRDLAGPFLAADARDGRREQFGDRGKLPRRVPC